MDEFGKLKQVAYLNADNVDRYRRIMYFCYQQNQRMNNLLYKADILEGVRKSGLPKYSEDQLDLDLATLSDWGNLTARQEMSQPRTIEEFKSKFFRYQISSVGIAIEELVHSLPNENENSNELDAHMFERLLETVQSIKISSDQELLDSWDDLLTRFDKVRKNATGYISYLTSNKIEDLMKTTAFLAYKLKFVQYLREFIRKMQQTSSTIQTALKSVDADKISEIAQLQIELESKKPTFNPKNSIEINDQIQDIWMSICNWFIDQESRPSEYTNLIGQTNEAIARVTGIIQTITESNQQHRSRSKDYQQIANWFQKLVDNTENEISKMNDANKISSLLFGFDNTLHIQTESMEIANQLDDLWEIDVPISELNSKSRKGRARTASKPFKLDPEKQALIQKQYQEKQQHDKDMWNTYLVNNILDLSKHTNLPQELRHDLIRYFSRSMIVQSHQIRTKMGWIFEISVDLNTMVKLEFDDGELIMPNVIYKVLKGNNDGESR